MYHIAIDGPSGAGKSTVAKMLAAKLGIAYLDTGAMYRAVGLYMIRRGIEPDDEKRVTEALNNITLEVIFCDGKQVVLLNGENVSETIRRHDVSAAASAVSKHESVRVKLVEMQREIATKQSFVLDGRDIGTVVLPKAKYKFYLTASAEVRGMRRAKELAEKGQSVDFEQICADIRTRDHNDMTRKISPLKQAEDAILVDSSQLDITGVLDKISAYIRED